MRDRCPSEEQLSARLDGAVASSTAQRLDAHVRNCGDCRACLEGLRAVRDTLRSLPPRQVPPEVLRNAAAAGERAELHRSHRVHAGVVAAALVAAVVAGAVVEQHLVVGGDRDMPADLMETRQEPHGDVELLRAAGVRSVSATGTILRSPERSEVEPATVEPVQVDELEADDAAPVGAGEP
ncbi:hypothetical protein ER308_17665 [Egibacter rhizosphaerae]|uniref:Putative zinc-finger domain-containing protein n=1 Tax=Egibacter rhizosphaerae TaxID=1670831 RepID=A0A411YIT1_9ACTN|nr:zf-HC2 domain-containing protein [Egibacter rhizosphaerae]QBI21215.1 hypothetical protein ER308_17665 [Egibacter rhizosphaerae]